ncbi:MAG: chitobiase/beta-hexosaminidase C-terminal domain-containing protein [Muribaculaceae bacterium]|nr:chitobiase/beta-hexosaminidase C-terminal domain-containing protein [Muribaculaceae bacterium]
MKTFLKTGALLVSLGAFASSPDPTLYQYWFDNDVASRVNNTRLFEAKSNPLEVDVSGLSEGGHALNFRMANKDLQWGSVMKSYFTVPFAPDESTNKAVAYRVWVNKDIVASGPVSSNSDFILTADMPQNPALNSVNSREFRYRTDEKTVNMNASGKFVCAFQMLSESNEWGIPLFTQFDHSVTAKLPAESVSVPYDYTFAKPDNNGFKAYRFSCTNTSELYLKASQDCCLGLYRVDTSEDSNLSLIKTFILKSGEMTKYSDSTLSNGELVGIIYDTKKDASNPDDDVFLRIMYEDNKLPKPVISFDPETWEVSISCADQRAEIHYTLDGNQPTHDSPVFKNPIKLDKFTKVMAIAVYGDLGDSEVASETIADQSMRIPKPKLEFYGGKDKNEFIFTNSIEGVTTYYVFGNGDLYDEGQRKTFDGKPFVIEDGASLKAYSVKDLLADSEVLSMTVNLNDYVTPSPKLSETKTEGEGEADYKAIRNFIRLSVPEGSAKYRVLPGKQNFDEEEEIIVEQWTSCEDGWIELPGGPFAGNQTVQVFAETNGKARSSVVSFFTDWVKALKPNKEFDNNRLKLSSDMPEGVIKYNIGSYNPDVALVYKAEELPDGIDVSEISMVTAWVEAEGYSASDRITVNTNDYDLASPVIRYEDDGYLHITHDVADVNLIVKVEPEQKLETIAPNHLRFKPEYNTRVEAYATKKGYNDSEVAIMRPVAKPIINVDAYKVTIDYSEGEVYYTVDNLMPTKESAKYTDPFETAACTVRAVAFKDGMIPGEAEPAKVMDQAAMPEIDIIEGYAKLTTSTPDATIYYSLNQGISDGNRKVYDEGLLPDGIDLSDVRTLYAYAEAEGYRRSETLDFFKSGYTLDAPSLRYADGYVIANHDDDSVEIMFTDVDGIVMQPDENNNRRVQVAYNSTIDAYAYKKGYVPSEKVRLDHTDIPQITADLFTVTIKKKSSQTVRYTTDGSQPVATSMVYENPFVVSESCTVRAVAFEGDLIPTEGESCPIGYVRCQRPEKDTYDGRYLTLSVEEGSSIRYVLGQSTTDVREGSVYSGKIDMNGLTLIRAIAQRADAADSEVMEFTPEYYANESVAFTSQPGQVKDAFGWCSDKSRISSLTLHGPLVGTSTVDTGDYEFLRSFPNLQFMDLRNVTDSYIPDGALDSDKLLSIVLPMQLSNAGSDIFGSSNSSLCALEWTSDDVVPEHLLSGLQNSNLLLYAKSATNASKAVENTNGVVKNVIGTETMRAENVTLCHGLPFYAPKEFTANKISFTRSFNKETQIGGFGSGWETMVVPFDVQSIESAGRTLKPFGEENIDMGVYPFWLFSAGETKWKKDNSVIANTPYLIAMPNNPQYADEFVVKGDVIFKSINASVSVTPTEEDMKHAFGVGRYVVGNYTRVSVDEGKLAINEFATTYQNQDYMPGGIFISNERDVAPFECYVESQGAKGIPVFDSSAVDELIGDYGTYIWSESYSICIRSSIAMKIRIYDMVGQLIRIVDVKAGETVRVDDMTPGIYFVGTTKILVKG